MSHVYLSPVFRRCPAAARLRCDGPHPHQRRSGRRRSLGRLRRRRTCARPQDPARHRAEPHVGLGTQPMVGRCAGARPFQRISPSSSTSAPRPNGRSGCTSAPWRTPTANRWRKRELDARSARRPAARSNITTIQLAAGPRLVGRAAGGRRPVPAEGRRGCFDELERLARIRGDRATADRTRLPARGSAAQDILEDAHRAGQLQQAVDRAQGDTELVDAVIAAAVIHASWLETRRRADQLPALLRCRLPGRHSCRAARVFEATHARIER